MGRLKQPGRGSAHACSLIVMANGGEEHRKEEEHSGRKEKAWQQHVREREE